MAKRSYATVTQEAQEGAEAVLQELGDEEYIDACEELAGYFATCAQAKREELGR